MVAYGSNRTTQDVDVLVKDLPPDLRPHEHLSIGGERYMFEGVAVDAIRRSDRWTFVYHKAMRHSKPFKGRRLRIVTPPWLALLKYLSDREHDIRDLKYLIRSRCITLSMMERVLRSALGPRGGLVTYQRFERLFKEVDLARRLDLDL